MSDLPLANRIALVTGASRGIGRAAALALAAAGAQIVAVARTPGALEALDDEIRTLTGQPATLVPMDIAEGDGLDQLGQAIHQRFGRLDVLVHAAAILGPITPVAHIEPNHWDRIVAVNLTASYRLIRSVEPLLRASDRPRILRGRISDTKGTRIDACMRSAMKRRGSVIFRTVPRIAPLEFPQQTSSESRQVRSTRPPAPDLARTGRFDASLMGPVWPAVRPP